VADIMTGLEGLPIDEFFEESYKQLLLRNPEYLSSIGMAEAYGLRHDRLNDLSDAYIRETQELEAVILYLLLGYDRAKLTPEQKISYDVYEWYLDDLVRGHEFMYHHYPVTHMLGSWDDELIRLLTELHPLDDPQDAEDYIARLSQVDDQVEQLLDGLKRREELGIIPPRFIVAMALHNLDSIANSSPGYTPFYTAFSEKLQGIEGLGESEKQAFLEAAETEIAESVIPGFGALADYFSTLQASATDDEGVWKLPNGDAYYAYILRQQASIDITPEEVHELGLAEVERIQAEMRQVFDELGYPQDAGLGYLMNRAIDEGGYYDLRAAGGGEQVIEAYEALLDEVDQALDPVVDIRPEAEVIVMGGPMGGFYVPAPLDGSRPGVFHASTGGSLSPKFIMPTIAYHEAIPGHHFQIAIGQEMDLPLFRNDIFFNGYGEGWALYAEQLAWELGLYDDDPYGNLGRLQMELLRAVRLVVDTGIHAKQWTRAEAKAYMNEALGDPSGRLTHEVERYIVLPAQATGYKIGMLKILELRQRAMDELGDEFDIKEFHNLVLGSGSMPLDILERVVQEYIDAKLGRASTSGRASTQASYEPLFEPDICHFTPPYGYEVECGYLVVPENRSKPDSPSIRIHVAIFKSTNPDPKPDPVIYVAGGGGVNQVAFSESYLNHGGNDILQERDYIMYNQRGAHLNDPSLVCPDDTSLFWSLARQELSPHDRADRKIESRLACHDALLEKGIDLTAYNTVETAADVNDLRIALGYDEINLYGTSSGTRTILTLMRNHPEGIRSVILDSVYPPQVGLYSTVSLSVDRVFSLLFETCAADLDCNQKYPDLEATFYQTVDDLNANPASIQLSQGTVLVDGGLFMDAVYLNFYSTDAIPRLPSWIQAASQGDLLGLKSTFEGILSDTGTAIAIGFEWSLQCNEEVPFESYELGRELAAGLPPQIADYFDSYFEFTLCESWQAGQADPVENTAVVSDLPALILAGQFDPVTPPEWSQLAAETLSNHFYYEFPGQGHGIMRSDPCGLKIGLQFLEDPTREPDASCLDELTGPEFN
jgi:uncharacterized protein (DUF885 family)/pimeloyl-ACP methyl ester carboxylesterase